MLEKLIKVKDFIVAKFHWLNLTSSAPGLFRNMDLVYKADPEKDEIIGDYEGFPLIRVERNDSYWRNMI